MGNMYTNQKSTTSRSEERPHKYGPSVIHLIAIGGILLIMIATIFAMQS